MRKFLFYFLSIICIGIFVLNSHISNAWTWADFRDYCIATKNLGSYASTNDMVKYIANNWNHVDTQVRRFLDPDDFNNFIIDGSTLRWAIYFYNGTPSWYTNSNKNLTMTQITTHCIGQYSFNSTATDLGNINYSSSSNASMRGLIDTEPISGGYGQFILQNAYNYINVIPRDNLTTNNLPWYIADGRIGNLYINDDLHFYLNGTDYKKMLYENEVVSSPYILRQLEVSNIIDLINGGTYYITLESSGDNIYLTSEDFVFEWENVQPEPENPPGGTITNPSGDITGKIDLTNIENSLNNIDNGIQELPNKFYNDGSGEPGIFQKVYNDLFTLDSGDVTEIYDNLKDHFTSGDTPLITFTSFLDVLGQEPGDFIIQWDSIPINLTIADGQTLVSGDFISGDSINFSALARENDVLATCKFWINTILSFSVITILLFESYRIILKAMGVATDLYNEADQDEQTTLTESESSGTITNPTTGEVRLQNIRKTRTITTRRRF